MPRSSRNEEFSAFVQARRTALVRSAYLLTAGDTHLAAVSFTAAVVCVSR